MDNLLNKFVKTIDNKSISATAKEFNISQPALSITLHKLEKRLGAKLFLCSKQGITPTPIGKEVYEQGREVLNSISILKQKVDSLNNKSQKYLRIGMIDNFGLVFLKMIWKKITNIYPDIQMDIEINNSRILIDKIQRQTIDLAVITQQKPNNLIKNIKQEYLMNDELIMSSSPDIAKKIQKIEDVREFPFFSYNAKSTTHKLITNFFIQNNIKPRITVYSASPAFILDLLKIGQGIAFLPKNYIESEINSGNLSPVLPKISLIREIALISNKNAYMSKRKKEIITIIKKAV